MKNRLKQLREVHKWSQADLGRELGVSRQAVNGFESGKFDPSLEMAFKIATLFDVPLENIFIYEVKNFMETLVQQFKKMFGFERFTEKAIDAVKFAHNEATKSLSPQLEPEHLLLGLLADPMTTSAGLLKSSGMTLNIEITDRSFEIDTKPNLSPQTKLAIELALEIVRLKGKKFIGTEHLLWGLVRLSETENPNLNELFQRYEIDIEVLNDRLAAKV